MDATQPANFSKATQNKVQGSPVSSDATPTIKVKPARSRRADQPESQDDAAASPSEPAQLQELIATTAYYLAAERNFSPGQEIDDWLEAERRVLGTPGISRGASDHSPR